MLTENDIKEELSYAYIHAIASKAGYACQKRDKDRDSIDASIHARGKLDPQSQTFSPTIDIQLKATSSHEFDGETLSFPISIKNYDDLRAHCMAPRILVVLILPTPDSDWLAHSETQLISKRCAYWVSLHGMEETSNTDKITIHIPKANIFSPDVLKSLMIKASKLEELS